MRSNFLVLNIYYYIILTWIPGNVHCVFPKWDDHYEWNKVTTCVHNLFGGGNRWVDQYGEMIITNKPYNLTCKLSFVKVSFKILNYIFLRWPEHYWGLGHLTYYITFTGLVSNFLFNMIMGRLCGGGPWMGLSTAR